MVFVSTLSSRLHRAIASPLLRWGLTSRYAVGGGVIRDNPYLDGLFLLPLTQRIISIETQEEEARQLREANRPPSALDRFVDYAWDRFIEPRLDPKTTTTDLSQPNGEAEGRQKPSDAAANSARPKTEANYRLEALESYLRPALVPRERWADVIRWSFHHRFIKWVRTEFLIAKHARSLRKAASAHPDLHRFLASQPKKPSSSFPRLSSSNSRDAPALVLPSADLLRHAWKMHHWSRRRNDDASWTRMAELAEALGGKLFPVPDSTLYIPDIPPEADLSSLDLQDILELAGAHVSSTGPLNVVCEEAGLFEIWTRDYVAALSAYLWDRTQQLTAPSNDDKEVTILDVGAGDGALAYHLRKGLKREALLRRRNKQQTTKSSVVPASTTSKQKAKKSIRLSPTVFREDDDDILAADSDTTMRLPRVVATDNGSWGIPTKAQVERMDIQQALDKYASSDSSRLIVLCSWMPMGQDWTHQMRQACEEYILIGEYNDGNCGDNWYTWGNPLYFPQKEQDAAPPLAPFVLDGFERVDLDHISRHQFSRYDTAVSSCSKTVSFRRKK